MTHSTLIDLAKAVCLRSGRSVFLAPLAISLVLLSGCGQIRQPAVEPFYAVSVPPPKQELRWSNGKIPKSFDPARAAAAPETDIVRAAYEGLTNLNSKTLQETPGVAEKWECTADLRTWTFHLRKDARWSNGEHVTARDFVRSWKRLRDLHEKAANTYLFQNIVGMRVKDAPAEKPGGGPSDFLHQSTVEPSPQFEIPRVERGTLPRSQPVEPQAEAPRTQTDTVTAVPAKREPVIDTSKFGVEALDDLTLKVSLELPDKDFPKLAANPIFCPVYGAGSNFEQPQLDADTITNGPFKISKIGGDGITMERSDNYWDKKAVALDRVRFVAANSAEAALDAYKKGEVDVVTNAAFEPLALKLLAPYEDFRRTTHSALNFYEFNIERTPFDDRRVREALAIAIDREKLTDSDLEGTTQPATEFLPIGGQNSEALSFDAAKAKQLLQKAGYAGGEGFPSIRLVINRNDTQQRVARSVARMWKQNLNLDTVIVVKESAEIEEVRRSGDFDLLRRGLVLPANDDLVNLASIFDTARKVAERAATETKLGNENLTSPDKQRPVLKNEDRKGGPLGKEETMLGDVPEAGLTLTEEDAIYELKAIPLYFPTSYSLVEPYVRGFETNGLDAPSLKEVSIDNTWQPKTARGES